MSAAVATSVAPHAALVEPRIVLAVVNALAEAAVGIVSITPISVTRICGRWRAEASQVPLTATEADGGNRENQNPE